MIEMLNRDDCVLVVIDVQEKLLPVINDREKILKNNVRLARFAGVISMPVLVTEQENLGPTVGELMEELPGVEPVLKIDFDACGCEEFSRSLEKLGRKTVIITGIESHVCVTQTVLHLLPEYTVHVVSDAVSSRTGDNLEVALQRMRDAGAVISSTEMVIFELLEKAGTDEFRATLKLVK